MDRLESIVILSLALAAGACADHGSGTNAGDAEGTEAGGDGGPDGSGDGTSSDAESGGASSTGADSNGADSTGADSTGADSTGADSTDADSTDADSTGSGSDGRDGIEIAGVWIGDIVGTGTVTHTIDSMQWHQVTPAGLPQGYTWTLLSYDNATRTAIGQGPFGTEDFLYSKHQWTFTGTQLWYCRTAMGQASQEEAEGVPDSNTDDPATSGCHGGPWSALSPG